MMISVGSFYASDGKLRNTQRTTQRTVCRFPVHHVISDEAAVPSSGHFITLHIILPYGTGFHQQLNMLHHMMLGMLGRTCGNPQLQIISSANLLHKAVHFANQSRGIMSSPQARVILKESQWSQI